MKNRIEEKTSRTAEYTCSSRASSYFETDPYYHSEDYIAARLVPSFVRVSCGIGFLRRFLLKLMAPTGVYEYVIARTKYIDNVFKQAVTQGFEQVLIFGAGFDSRSIRLLSEDALVKVFEVDAEITQSAKLMRFKEIGVKIPANTVYVPIDFNKENPEEKLLRNGFMYGKRCLFILEGLLMYINEDAIEETFKLIHRLSAPGSLIVFDYIYASVIRREGKFYGEEGLHKNVENAGEPWAFGFEEGEVGRYLQEKGFTVVEECNSEELERRYFTDISGSVIGKINGTHSLVLARVEA